MDASLEIGTTSDNVFIFANITLGKDSMVPYPLFKYCYTWAEFTTEVEVRQPS